MSSNARQVTLDYTPRVQFKPLHSRAQRFGFMVCHRRAGKTVACVNELVIRGVYTQKKHARFAYVAPYYRQAKDIAWQYLKQATHGFAVQTRESDLRVVLPNGAWITLYGADNPDALRGIYLDGLIMDEFGDCRPSLWGEVLLPTLLDRKGWAVFIGTFKGKNHFYQMSEKVKNDTDWYHMILKASESGILSEEDLKLARSLSDDATYLQEFECDPNAAVKGTYYAAKIDILERTGHIGNKTDLYNPNLPVYAAADIGKKDSTAMWLWQEQIDDERPIKVINYREAAGEEISDWLDYFKTLPYDIEKLWFPKDAKAATFQSTRSTIQQFIDGGHNCGIVPSLSVQHGIDAVRAVLNLCVIDHSACSQGVESLRGYQRVFDELLQAFRDTPLHNWCSDGADAFRYLSMVAARKTPTLTAEPPPPPEMARSTYKLDELWQDRENGQILSLVKQRI